MADHAEQISFVDVHFDVTLKERVRRFLEQFAPTYTGYILDQTPNQLHSKEFIIRIYYDEYSTFTITCYSSEMMQQRIQNILNINKQLKFINLNPTIEEHYFSTTENGKEDVTIYYTATLEFGFTKP